MWPESRWFISICASYRLQSRGGQFDFNWKPNKVMTARIVVGGHLLHWQDNEPVPVAHHHHQTNTLPLTLALFCFYLQIYFTCLCTCICILQFSGPNFLPTCPWPCTTDTAALCLCFVVSARTPFGWGQHHSGCYLDSAETVIDFFFQTLKGHLLVGGSFL